MRTVYFNLPAIEYKTRLGIEHDHDTGSFFWPQNKVPVGVFWIFLSIDDTGIESKKKIQGSKYGAPTIPLALVEIAKKTESVA